jgi:hypothetical protein
MSNIYKVTLKGTPGALYINYKNGHVKECLFTFDPFLDAPTREKLLAFFPMEEDEMNALRQNTSFDYQFLVPKSVADKTAMFCMTFRDYRTTAYTPQKVEKANLADVMVSKSLLEVYFTTNDFPLNYAKSITDYIKNYNFIRDLEANGKPKKNAFPDVYDREYERTLAPEKLSSYWQHLLKLGWKKVDGTWTNQATL